MLALALTSSLIAFAAQQDRRPAPAPASHAVERVQLMGGGPVGNLGRDHIECVPPAEMARVQARIAANRARLGLDATSFVPFAIPEGQAEGGIAGSNPFSALLYKFWPQSGTWFADLLPPGYVDDDAASGAFHDYNCNPFTYDGHAGIDVGLPTFEEQSIGVPVFAALDGLVIDAHDGEPDQNTVPQGVTNIVVLDHGLGRETLYFHLKKDSVAVQLGQFVKAGTQIGMTGSSGYSWGPHLHFQSMQIDQVFDPFAGACRSGDSGFAQQPPESLTNLVVNAAFTDVDLSTIPGPPEVLPHTGQVTLTTPKVYLYLWTANLPTQSTWHFRVRRPNGTIANDIGPWSFFNPEIYRTAWYWWEFDEPEMKTTTGQWSIDILFNEVFMTNVPITVNATFNPNFNRVPAAIAAALEPTSATSSDALTCRVSAPLVVDDLDFDIVRYQYVWKINGSVVRTVVSAGRSDMLPRDAAQPGQTVTCTITPNDGKVSAAPVTVTKTFAALCPNDLNHDGTVDAADLATLLGAWGLCQ